MLARGLNNLRNGRPSVPTLLFLAAALLIGGVAAGPLFSDPGLLNTRGGGDSPFLLQRVQQLVTTLQDGHFPPRWMPDANYGYGYPFFHYYASLSLFVAALFRFAGFSYVLAIKLAQLSAFLVAAGGAFYLGRRWLGSAPAGLLAAAAYTLAPFHMVNVYVRGDSLAEFWAMAFYPLVLLAADELLHRPLRRNILLFALAYAGLILSHNISALIFSPFLLLFLLLGLARNITNNRSTTTVERFSKSFHTGSNKQHPVPPGNTDQLTVNDSRPSMKAVVLALGLALLLSAWFWLPALAETGLAQTEPVTSGFFHYSNHFLSRPVQRSFFFDYDVTGRSAFRMGLLQTLLVLPGLVLLLRPGFRPHSLPLLYVVLLLLGSTIMLLPLSRPLWDALPLLPYVQFPWRFLSIQALATSLLIGGLAWLPGRRFIVPATLLLLLLSGLGRLRTTHLPLTDADVTPFALAQYEWFTGNIGTTVSAEYLPRTVQPRPYTSPWLNTGERDRAVFLSGDCVTATLQERQAAQQTWQLDQCQDNSAVLLPLLYWPGWQATLDGEAIPLQPAPGSGLALIEGLPAGSHTLTLHLARTPIRLLAELLSLAGLIIAAIILLAAVKPRPHRTWLILPAAILALLLAGRLWPQPAYPAGTATWDFAQLGYLHHAPQGIPFSAGSLLRSYVYSANTLDPGKSLIIVLEWEQIADGTDVTIDLVTPAVHRTPHAPPLLTATTPAAAGRSDILLTLPDNVPAGLVIPRLTLPGTTALTPSGEPRGDLFLRPLRITGDATPLSEETQATLTVSVDETQLIGDLPQRQPAGWTPPQPFGCNDHHTANAQLLTRLTWLTTTSTSHNLQVSLRLLDAAGTELVLCDSQPGYGYLPTTGWPARRPVHDWLALPLPPQLTAASPYYLTARLYTAGTNDVLLTRRLGRLDWQGNRLRFQEVTPSFAIPPGIEPAGATFGDVITLHGYDLDVGEDTLTVRLIWGALVPGREDFHRFVHLLDTTTGEIATQRDGIPQNDTYPTGQWTAGEVITDVVTLNLSDVPPGTYTLAVGLYHPEPPDYPRLPALDPTGRPLPDNRLILLEDLNLR